jgi:4-amino-4-deoxy-L-arabinose transferase-like glycosyltransferase
MWEEGNNAVLARDVLARGAWLEPAIFGLRYVEKPSLYAWLVAGLARLTGDVNEWSTRFPALLAIVATALLVLQVTRRHASVQAALFAAGAFMCSPLLLRKLTIGEPDTLVTFLSFAAFVVWWDGEARGHVTAARWLACGGLLAAVSMAKGPQPVGFFALGVGGDLVLRHRWTALPGLIIGLGVPVAATIVWATAVYRPGDLAVWLEYMRLDGGGTLSHYLRERGRFARSLPLELLPSTLVLASAVVLRDRPSNWKATQGPFLRALGLYAGLCTLALLAWPGTKTRYAMPIAPAVAVMAGLTIEPLWRRRHWTGDAAVALAVILLVFQVVFVTVVLPLQPERFNEHRQFAAAVDSAVRAAPAPLFTIGFAAHSNKLFYVTSPIQALLLPDGAGILAAPAWLLASPSDLERARTLRPDLTFHAMPHILGLDSPVLARIERGKETPAPGTNRGTILQLLVDLGGACVEYQDRMFRNLPCRRIQCDEIWSFVHAKQKNVPTDKLGTFGYGDVWT